MKWARVGGRGMNGEACGEWRDIVGGHVGVLGYGQ